MRIILLLFLIFFASCNMIDSNTENGPAYLRIINEGDIDFQSIKVRFTGPEVQYGELAAGHISEYKLFDEVYHYSFIEVETETKTYRLVPVDFVGESPLKPGQYTYEMKIEEDDLVFRFVD